MPRRVTIVDYGMGNLWSVYNALNYLDVATVISNDPATIVSADTLILPGVGSYASAITELKLRGLDVAIKEAVEIRKRKILGICLGMQLLAESSLEDGFCKGLGIINGTVHRFNRDRNPELKIPHMGFNQVLPPAGSQLFASLPDSPDFYFVHSFRLLDTGLPGQVSLCNYDEDFVAAYEHENIFATQFHPEKSQTNGLMLLSNFIAA